MYGKLDGMEEDGKYMSKVCELLKDCEFENGEEVEGGMEKIIG